MGGGNPLIADCVIENNRHDGGERGGGIHFMYGGATVRNCLIRNNWATGGGIGGSENGVYTIENCTIVSNYSQSSTGGGGLGLRPTFTGTFYNCIVYSNKTLSGINPDIFMTNINTSTFFTNCCSSTWEGLPGSDNITNYPAFAAPATGDYHLAKGSPCINRGLNREWMTGTLDLDGRPRIMNGTVDIGAYEYPLVVGTVILSR